MWEDNNYCWVVLCKNNWFHRRENLFYKHRIPLAETDVYAPVPALKSSFTARCDECHKEYSINLRCAETRPRTSRVFHSPSPLSTGFHAARSRID